MKALGLSMSRFRDSKGACFAGSTCRRFWKNGVYSKVVRYSIFVYSVLPQGDSNTKARALRAGGLWGCNC